MALHTKPITVFCLALYPTVAQDCLLRYQMPVSLLDNSATVQCWSSAALWCGKVVRSVLARRLLVASLVWTHLGDELRTCRHVINQCTDQPVL